MSTPAPFTVNRGFFPARSTNSSEVTLRLFPAAAFHTFWQTVPRSFGGVDEEAELELRSNNFVFILRENSPFNFTISKEKKRKNNDKSKQEINCRAFR